jgi:uncharacterized glyoxalase superfamily metalloenzyme YdcJ
VIAADGGCDADEADDFVAHAVAAFALSREPVEKSWYDELSRVSAVAADIAGVSSTHINHLTPRVLDIDRAQAAMLERGIRAKDAIEGPPKRKCPILLRQTSFLALEEPIRFRGADGADGTHTARFGEIEQRGCALTPKGRGLYDEFLSASSKAATGAGSKASALAKVFEAFPDDARSLHRERLAYFRYSVDRSRLGHSTAVSANASVDALLEEGVLRAEPLVYEDFLPVSAAGIFRSNLGSEGAVHYAAGGHREAFEAALGTRVIDEFALYEAAQSASLEECRRELADLPAMASS